MEQIRKKNDGNLREKEELWKFEFGNMNVAVRVRYI